VDGDGSAVTIELSMHNTAAVSAAKRKRRRAKEDILEACDDVVFLCPC